MSSFPNAKKLLRVGNDEEEQRHHHHLNAREEEKRRRQRTGDDTTTTVTNNDDEDAEKSVIPLGIIDDARRHVCFFFVCVFLARLDSNFVVRLTSTNETLRSTHEALKP